MSHHNMVKAGICLEFSLNSLAAKREALQMAAVKHLTWLHEETTTAPLRTTTAFSSGAIQLWGWGKVTPFCFSWIHRNIGVCVCVCGASKRMHFLIKLNNHRLISVNILVITPEWPSQCINKHGRLKPERAGPSLKRWPHRLVDGRRSDTKEVSTWTNHDGGTKNTCFWQIPATQMKNDCLCVCVGGGLMPCFFLRP